MASTDLTITLGTATDLKTWTWSAWIKRSKLGLEQGLYNGDATSNYWTTIYFDSSDRLHYQDVSAGSSRQELTTNRVFRDTSAWYNIQVVYDSTEGTASNRLKFYVNGVQETSFATSTYPSSNETTQINGNDTTRIGSQIYSGNNDFDGSMTHVHFIDGTAYDADTFGETDATTGIWIPKTAPSVTYGTNGFFLKGENSGALGTDSSGNANNFTVNGTPTQTIDTPSNVFATLNPLSSTTFPTFAHGNTQTVISTSDSNGAIARGTMFVSKGKYYWEVKMTANSASVRNEIGVETADSMASNIAVAGLFGTGKARGYRGDGLTIRDGNTTASYGASYTNGDIIGVALDIDAGTLVFYKNGVSQGTAFSDLTNDTWGIALGQANNTFQVNTGNGFFGTTAVASAQNPDDGIGIFEYDVPTGYKALCTKSINAQEYS